MDRNEFSFTPELNAGERRGVGGTHFSHFISLEGSDVLLAAMKDLVMIFRIKVWGGGGGGGGRAQTQMISMALHTEGNGSSTLQSNSLTWAFQHKTNSIFAFIVKPHLH